MILFPAIDLKGGACVRLRRDKADEISIFRDDPADQARALESAGFRWLHMVDLDGVAQGRSVNKEAVEAVLQAVSIPVQLGGGLRSLADIEHWMKRGVRRVVLGTSATADPGLVQEACQRFPGRIAVNMNVEDGFVAAAGWSYSSSVRALDLALAMEKIGVAAILYADIRKEGSLGALDIDATVDLAFALNIPVVANGGVASLSDLAALKQEEAAGIEGVVIGAPLYDGRIDPEKALALLREGEESKPTCIGKGVT